jgi:transcriptional regulator with AAA-type ATPase domain
VSYVLVAALRASPSKEWGILALLALPPLLLVVWARSVPPSRGEDWVSPITRTSMRACGFGGALLAAARVAPPGSAVFDAVATAGTTLASTASLVAIARIAPLGGILVVPKRAQRPYAAIAVALVGALATSVALAQAILPTGPFAEAWMVEAAATTSAAASLAVTILTAWSLRRLRRLDLGASERLSAALTLGWVALVVGVPASFIRVAPPSHVLPVAAWLAAFATSAACLARDPTFVARAQRILVAVTILGAPAALFAASLASQIPREAGLIALVAVALGIVIGLAGIPIARPLGPEQSRWIDAINGALRAALRSDPETAITSTLATLRQAFGPSSATPELWRVDPPTLMTVDRAGYPHAESGLVAPEQLFELAEREPEQTIRTEVLETLEVRRTDIRPALEWLRSRGAMSFTLLTDEEGAIGALVLPVANRTHPLTLEEVRTLRTLADRLTALLGVSSALARAQAREVEARRTADREEDRALRLEHQMASGTERHEALTRKLAKSARLAAYSPAARLAVETLERLGEIGAPVSLLTPPGIDPIPYAAVVHNSGARRSGPFVVVDAAGAEEQLESTWRDGVASPVCLADGGSLVILSVASLSAGTQAFLAGVLSERRSPAGHPTPLEMSLIVSVPTTVDTLAATGQLDPLLADRLGDRAVPLPPLSARAEDLRPLFVDRLARLGVRLRGRPMGLDPRALGRLVEHGWPGNEVELDDVLTRAVAIADADVLTSAHLDQIGFVSSPPAVRRGSRPPAPGQYPLRS